MDSDNPSPPKDAEEQIEAPEEQTPEQQFELRVTEDRLAVVLKCTVDPKTISALVRDVMTGLDHLNLASAPDAEELERRIQDASRTNPEISAMLVVKGKPVIPPNHGEVLWQGDFFNAGFVTDEKTGIMDFRSPAAQASIEQGQLLARIKEPQEGVDGQDVFGKTIPVDRASPAQIVNGENVRHDADENEYYADCAGRICWVNEVLSVDIVYRVEGNVGLESGNIEHPGTLVVEGDIERECSINVKGDIEVHGLIEPCLLETGGSLFVQGGLTGDEHHHYRVAKDVHARFVLDAAVDVDGEVVVDREIRHSTIRARGSISVPRGTVVGGHIASIVRIEVGNAGSEALVPTHLDIPVDEKTIRAIAAKQKEMDALRERLLKIQLVVTPLASKEDQLSPQKLDVVKQLREQAEAAKEALEERQAAIDELKQSMEDRPRPVIIVRDHIFPEAVFSIHGENTTAKQPLKGPIKVTLIRGEVKFSDASEL